MERVKVKYCHSEDELNNFLAILHTDRATYPQLDSIYYVPSIHGSTGNYGYISNDIVAAVQYYINVEEEKDNGLNF